MNLVIAGLKKEEERRNGGFHAFGDVDICDFR